MIKKDRQTTWTPIEDSFLLGAVGGWSRVTQMLTVSFWGRAEVVAVVTVMVGGSSRGAGTGGMEAAAGGGATSGKGAGEGLDPWARPPVRMLQRLSEELLRPDWLLASLPLSCWSRYVSWADSVLLCAVTEMRGLDVPRGGTGGGAFLLMTAVRNGRKRKNRRKLRSALETSWHGEGCVKTICQKTNVDFAQFAASQTVLKATFALPVYLALRWHHSVSRDHPHHDTPSAMCLRGQSTRLPGSINHRTWEYPQPGYFYFSSSFKPMAPFCYGF